MSRYELQTFAKGKRGKVHRAKTLTIEENDPHAMAVEYWRLTHSPGCKDYTFRILDHAARSGGLVLTVTYEELVRRARSVVP